MTTQECRVKDEQVASLRRAVDDIESETAVGVMIVIHQGDDGDHTMSVASANMTPLETLTALLHAAKMVRDRLTGETEEDLH